MDGETPAAVTAIPCNGWYALFQGDNNSLFLIPLIGWERVDGQWTAIMQPGAVAPEGFQRTAFVRGVDIANLREGDERLTWNQLFDELVLAVLRHNRAQTESEA